MARRDGSIVRTEPRDFFRRLYDQLAETGVCDGAGGIELDQVFADWFEAGADRDTAEQFIRERTNTSGWFDADGTPVPAEREKRRAGVVPKSDPALPRKATSE